MNVTCPQCGTVYRLPEEKAKPGARLRCSVCRHIFTLQEEPVEEPLSLGETPRTPFASELEMNGLGDGHVSDERSRDDDKTPSMDTLDFSGAPEPAADAGEKARGDAADCLDMPEEKQSRFKGMFGMLFLAAVVAGGIWAWQNTHYLDGLKTLITPEKEVTAPAPAVADSAIEKLELLDVAQYHVKNSKIGGLIVIEGKVRNNFSEPRELISLEAALYDAEGKELASRRQVAGISLNSFQLEVLDKTELENTLNRKLDIITSNINVMPGAEVPFTVVFTEIPAGARDYKVRIVDASRPKPVGNLGS